MRISELSTASGVSIPTIKFYLRDALLPPGTRRAVNQADYDAAHLHRLRLIRALTEIGGLRLRDVRSVLAAIDDDRLPLHDVFGVAQYALEGEGDERGQAAGDIEPVDRSLVDDVLDELGWSVNPDAPARWSLARALATLRQLGWTLSVEGIAQYGHAVDALAAMEVDALQFDGSRAEVVERLVSGTVLFEAVLNALRRLAQERHSAVRFGYPAVVSAEQRTRRHSGEPPPTAPVEEPGIARNQARAMPSRRSNSARTIS